VNCGVISIEQNMFPSSIQRVSRNVPNLKCFWVNVKTGLWKTGFLLIVRFLLSFPQILYPRAAILNVETQCTKEIPVFYHASYKKAEKNILFTLKLTKKQAKLSTLVSVDFIHKATQNN
jgi:hypothetical protein